jgi:spermidine/putrescine-binding protein
MPRGGTLPGGSAPSPAPVGLDRRAWLEIVGRGGAGAWALALGLSGCGDRGGARDGSGSAGLGPIEKELNLYLWSDYLADDTIPDFEREFGVRITLDTYESNEEMLAKLLAGATGYDLILPSNNVFPVLLANRLLAPLDWSYLTNRGNVAPLFANPAWDPGLVYSVPWQWGTTGIAYRRDLVPEPPDGWGVFLDARYRGKMTMLDDIRDVIGAFLKYRGRSLNSTVPEELAQARADAIQAKANLEAFISATVKAQLIAGDVWIAQLWNGDAAQARAERPEIEFVLPKEGTMIFEDALVLPRSARHPRAAHEFLNYVLRPEVAAAISDRTGYGTTNQAALPLTRAQVPYPTSTELVRLEYSVDLGRASELWDRIWTEIKTA